MSRLAGWTGPAPLPTAFRPRRTIETAERVREKLEGSESKPPRQYDLEDLYRRVRDTWISTKSLRSLATIDMKRLPWVLYFVPGAEARASSAGVPWLGEDPGLIRGYGAWLSQRSRSAAVRALMYNFLNHYPRTLTTFDSVRELLLREVRASKTPSVNRWWTRCRNHALLDADGDLRFLRSLMASGQPVASVLEAAGLTGNLAQSGFLKSGLLRYLQNDARSALAEEHAATLDRLLEFLTVEHQLRFNTTDIRVAIAVSLLAPFQEGAAPAAATRKRLKGFFLHCYGDPRLPNRGTRGWYGIPESARAVLMRWLAEETLDGFFRIVEDTALDRHWRYRRDFWRAYLDRGLIRDAWFALGSKASWRAEKLKLDGAATLRGAGPDQSVLILMMSGVTIVEWSNSGACRVWLTGHRNAPKPYRPDYYGSDLRVDSDLTLRHDGSEAGSWQDRLAQWLLDQTGVRVHRQAYLHHRDRGW